MIEITKVTVTLEIEGDPDKALLVVNELLDDGVFQEAINEYELDDDGTVLLVRSAIAT